MIVRGAARETFLTIGLILGGEETEELEDIEGGDEESSKARGAMGIGTSVVLLYAGYPSHRLPDRTHFKHCGLVSSHLTLRALSQIY
jgi:hypothetical protein